MGWLSRILGGERKARPAVQKVVRVVLAKYDAAQTSTDSYKHWSSSDDLSANSANSAAVRRVLRKRARYEVANNSYLKGIILTLANDVVGTGPRLQLTDVEPAVARAVEAAFADWCQDVGLAEKLRTMRMAKVVDGEAFAIMVNAAAATTGVKLDLRLVEAEMVTYPDLSTDDSIDGIYLDAAGRPIAYYVLDRHPGDAGSYSTEGRRVPADQMLHIFRADRPGQARGIPEITPCMELTAHLRRFTTATVLSAEAIANIAGVLETEASADTAEAADERAFDPVELERGTLMTLPGGYKMSQVKAETPATTYAEFKREVLNEIARCLNMPFNIAAGNSSGYNYSSGRLDHQTYYKAIRIEQDYLGRSVMDRVFRAWLDEARLVPGLLPAPILDGESVHHEWFWDGTEHVDPAREADAAETRLRTLTTTLAAEYAKQGLDYETQVRQIAKERALLRELGLTMADAAPARTRNEPDNGDDPDGE